MVSNIAGNELSFAMRNLKTYHKGVLELISKTFLNNPFQHCVVMYYSLLCPRSLQSVFYYNLLNIGLYWQYILNYRSTNKTRTPIHCLTYLEAQVIQVYFFLLFCY